MKILNTEFSEKGLKEFEKLTRQKQKELIKQKNPLFLPNAIAEALKGVKYAKPRKPKKEISESDKAEVAEKSSGASSDRHGYKKSEKGEI